MLQQETEMLQNTRFCNISLSEDIMKKIVIIGANDFQRPLIQKAKEMGYETHVFAWREGATGAADADKFYEISITEKEKILSICKEIQPQGVATIGSDLANITVQYLAQRLNLPGNSEGCIKKTTNKYLMRKALKEAGIPVPFFQKVGEKKKASPDGMERSGEITVPSYPVVVKPTDRSGSRAITRVEGEEELWPAIERAVSQSFEKKAIVEGCLFGAEYSVETVSFKGKHTCLAITKKFTTGEPHYIEVGHLEPAPLSPKMEEKIKETVFKALDALEVEYGASHSELRIDEEEHIHIIEIGSRMGGDCIGSDLVPLSTGWDYVKMVIDIACGKEPEIPEKRTHTAAIRFLMCEEDLYRLEELKQSHPECLKKTVAPQKFPDREILESGDRPGFYILQTDTLEEMNALLHRGPEKNPIEIYETPVQRLQFTDEKNHFFIKRDDLLPFSFGGNKVRFAEKFVADMQRKHCDAMILYGNYHSNLCRILSGVCTALSMPCYMVHNTEDVKEEGESLNSRLIKTGKVKEIPCGKKGIAAAVLKAKAELTEQGYSPYYIYGNALGEGNEWVPMEAYVQAYQEICSYEERTGSKFDFIFLASSTNATQSGLLMGSLLKRDGRKIVGISVSRNALRGREVIEKNIQAYAEKFQADLPEGWKEQILFTDAYMEGGYGAYSPAVMELIRSVYKSDGIPLDMTYTGKGFYGMVSFLKEKNICGKNILFWHTGGTPLFFDLLNEKGV